METLLFQESPIIVIVLLSIWFILMLLRSRWHLLIVIIFILCVLFYRNFSVSPFRKVDDSIVMSPADGKVSHIEYTKDNVRISIFLNLHNVHVQKSPIDGKVMSIDYYEGTFHPAGLIDKSKHNERSRLVLNTKYGPISIYQIAGVLARTIVTWSRPGQVLKSGQDFGMIKFGSRVDVEIPLQHLKRVFATVGQRVDFDTQIVQLF